MKNVDVYSTTLSIEHGNCDIRTENGQIHSLRAGDSVTVNVPIVELAERLNHSMRQLRHEAMDLLHVVESIENGGVTYRDGKFYIEMKTDEELGS